MRIAYFIDNSQAVNWGGQATSAGMKHLIRSAYPEAEIVRPAVGPLPWRKLPILRRPLERRLAEAIIGDDAAEIDRGLRAMNVDLDSLAGIDTVCFNGEGAIHPGSGHLYRLMGLLHHFRRRGAYVAALNQTVDLKDDDRAAAAVAAVYATLDRVAVREPASQRALAALGIRAELIADAAYAVPHESPREQAARRARFALPERYLCVTGSSAFRRDRRSRRRMDGVLGAIRSASDLPVVQLANTEVDRWVAERAGPAPRRVIDHRAADWRDAVAIIAGSAGVIGGRQHPNIFAATEGVPFLPLAAHTHKMAGVVELLDYPLPVLSWDEPEAVARLVPRLANPAAIYAGVTVPRIEGIRLA